MYVLLLLLLFLLVVVVVLVVVVFVVSLFFFLFYIDHWISTNSIVQYRKNLTLLIYMFYFMISGFV